MCELIMMHRRNRVRLPVTNSVQVQKVAGRIYRSVPLLCLLLSVLFIWRNILTPFPAALEAWMVPRQQDSCIRSYTPPGLPNHTCDHRRHLCG